MSRSSVFRHRGISSAHIVQTAAVAAGPLLGRIHPSSFAAAPRAKTGHFPALQQGRFPLISRSFSGSLRSSRPAQSLYRYPYISVPVKSEGRCCPWLPDTHRQYTLFHLWRSAVSGCHTPHTGHFCPAGMSVPAAGSPQERFYKPGGVYFEACSKGQLLLMEPDESAFVNEAVMAATEETLRRKAEAKHYSYVRVPVESLRYRFVALNEIGRMLVERGREG